jgi:hypothetical protein
VLADIISLATFFAGLWGRNLTSPSLLSLLLLLGLILGYSWIIICWVLVRKSFLSSTRKNHEWDFAASIGSSAIGVGFFLSPLLMIWALAIMQYVDPEMELGLFCLFVLPLIGVIFALAKIIGLILVLLMPLAYDDIVVEN